MTTEQPTITLFETEWQIIDNYDGLITISEIKDYLPEMESVLYDKFKEDIRQNGINDPILYIPLPDEKKLVVEGHTRLRAAIELGINGDSLPVKSIHEEFNSLNEIKLWMVKQQVQRRNLSSAQKLHLAMAYQDILAERARENLRNAGRGIRVNQRIDTINEIANLAGVSKETAKRYKNVYEKGTPELLQRVNDGKISIYNASNKVRFFKEREQEEHQYILVGNYERGIEMLKEGSIKSLVIVNEKNQIETFLPYQQKNFGFIIIETEP
jgi:ParB family chromosome partitioning protein